MKLQSKEICDKYKAKRKGDPVCIYFTGNAKDKKNNLAIAGSIV